MLPAILFGAFGLAGAAKINGVNVGGWLLIEEWMFSNGIFDKVAQDVDVPQGVILPPALPNGFGEKWYSEGDLINKLYKKFGAERTVDILEQHRATYVTSADYQQMATFGITKVRVPLGWWAFVNESISEPTLITDPAHPDRMFVTITHDFLRNTLRDIKNAGLTALLDIHAFPGGSADGSYNGVFPNAPLFFKDESLQLMGLDIVTNLCNFYNALDQDLKEAVVGVTLMNEPAHLMWEDGSTMLTWLEDAVEIYRDLIVSPSPSTHPLLFNNLISTSVSNDQMLDFMVRTFTEEERKTWAILDIHVYYAWDGSLSGCMDKWGDCGYTCDVDNDLSSYQAVSDKIYSAAKATHSYFINNGSVPLLSCSEFSLATYHDSNNACRGANMLDMMYSAQADGLEAQGILDRSMFWTWKMPYGGSHEEAWSIQHYLVNKK